MNTPWRAIGPESPCSYLPGRLSRFEYASLDGASPADYMAMMADGWRRFGRTAFRPRCLACDQCRSIRIDVARFRPDRSQRRAIRANADSLTLRIGRPRLDAARFDLYRRYHDHQTDAKGWRPHEDDDSDAYIETFVDNPFPTEEWSYFLGDELLAIGLVDALPGGLSGIYFYYDPASKDRSPGTYNVLSLISEARRRGLPHVYLGYFVEECPSMRYKGRFRPSEALNSNGSWAEFEGFAEEKTGR